MKTITKLVFLFALIIFGCGKDEENNPEDSDELIVNSLFTFSINEKDEFVNELALKVVSKNDISVKVYKTENATINTYDKIIYSDEHGDDFIMESNRNTDTLYIYQRDSNKNIVKEALRYVTLNETSHKLDFVTINPDKSITSLQQYKLTKNPDILSAKVTSLKRNTNVDDLEKEINDTGEFLADPTNTHPITAFYKGIVTKLFANNSNDPDESNDVYDAPSKGIISTIIDGLESKRKKLLKNLGKISDFLKESKRDLKDFTQEQIDAILKAIKESELKDDEIDDDILRDCKGEIDGPALIDFCGECVDSILDTCEKDCNEDFGGTAFLDDCNECVGGNTGKEACVQDCNGDFGGTAYLDNCDECVGGNTNKEECMMDCNGVYGGAAYLDNCNECVGGATGKEACTEDCNGDFGGVAYLDECNECVGGATGKSECDLQSFFENAVVGSWTVTTLESGNVNKLKLFAGGEGRYIIPGPNGANRDGVDENGDSFYSVTWRIEKRNGKYHLREEGFYHFGFEQNRSFDISLPNNFLTNPITFFETYTDFGSGPGNAGRRYTKN